METCPYKGLLPYTQEDARYFFGRETQCRVIRDNLFASRLTVLYGASGVGKSSVLGAGVAHDLENDPDYLVLVFRNWRDDPVAGLNAALEEKLAPFSGLAGKESNGPRTHLFPHAVDQLRSIDRTLLVVLDQFEDYFQYHPHEDGELTFAHEFPRLLRQEKSPVHFMISMREDALASLDTFKRRIPALFNNRLKVDFLSREAALDAILKPVQRFNDDHPASTSMKLGQDVAENVLDEIIEAQGEKSFVQTPYLQLVMTRWWDREVDSKSNEMRAQTLRELGGAKNIVERHLETTLGRLDRQEQNAVSEIVRFMVTSTGRKIALSVSELTEGLGSDFKEADIRPLLEKLREARVLAAVPPPRGSSPEEKCYEFAHDVVARAALDWRRHFRQKRALEEAEQRRVMQEKQQKFELDLAQAEALQEKARAKEQAAVAHRMRQRAIGLVVLFSAACAALAFGMWEFRKASNALARSERLTKATASHRLAAAAVSQVDAAPELSVLLAMYAVSTRSTPDAIDALNRSLWGLRLDAPPLVGHSGDVTSVAYSPDGTLIASGSVDHTARLWDANTGQLLRTLSGGDVEIRSVSFNQNGQFLVTAGSDDKFRIWDVHTGSSLSEGQGQGWLVAALCHPKSPALATAELVKAQNYNQTIIRIWTATDPGRAPEEKQHWSVPGAVTALSFSIDGEVLATAGSDHIVRVWVVATGKKLLELKGHTDTVQSVAFSPDNQYLASAGMDRTIRIWNHQGANFQTHLTGHTNTVFAVAYDREGRLVSASADARVKVWDPMTGRELLNFAGHTGPVQAVAFSPDGKHVVSGSWDRTLRIWDAQSHRDGVTAVAFSPDGTLLATGSRDRTVKIWDAVSKAERLALPPAEGEVSSIAFSHDGKRLAYATNCDDMDKVSGCQYPAAVWDVASGKMQIRLPSSASLNGISFHPDGVRVVTGGDAGFVKVWELKTGVRPHVLAPRQDQVNSVTFSKDGAYVAAATSDKTAELWDTQSGKLLRTLKGHDRHVMAVAFSNAGVLATASLDGTAKLWNTNSDDSIRTIRLGTNAVSHVAFSPSGKFLATGSWDRTARVWDLSANAKELNRFTLDSSVNEVAFSPDGHLLAIATEATRPQLYILDADLLMQEARARVRKLGITMRPEECQQYLRSKTCPGIP